MMASVHRYKGPCQFDTTQLDRADSSALKDAAGPSDPGPKPLPLKDKDDLKKLNGAATQEGMYGGMVFGGLLSEWSGAGGAGPAGNARSERGVLWARTVTK